MFLGVTLRTGRETWLLGAIYDAVNTFVNEVHVHSASGTMQAPALLVLKRCRKIYKESLPIQESDKKFEVPSASYQTGT